MIWDDDDFEPREKRPAGRPVENPFPTTESEEDFVRRAQSMLDLYYRPGGPNTKKDFVFGPGRAMSKTHFWSILFIYHTYQELIENNLQGFLSVVQRHFGPSVASDRTSISKNVSMQRRLNVPFKHSGTLTGADATAQQKYRSMYNFVIRRWEEG